jgi:hypothetical protein
MVVDVEEFEGAEDGSAFAIGTSALLAVGRHGGARDYAERITKGLLENLRSDRAVRKFETAFWAPQHPTGHVSALGPWSLKSDDIAIKKDATGRAEFFCGDINRKKKRAARALLKKPRRTEQSEETFLHSSNRPEVISREGIEVNSLNFGR